MDGLDLSLCRLNGLVHVGHVTVQAPVDPVHQVLLHLGIHHLHGRQGRADGGEHVSNGLALFEVGHIIGFSGRLLGVEVQLRQQGLQLSVNIVVGGGQLQVITLLRVSH